MKERFLLVIVVLALASGAALADGYIADVPDANQPAGNPMGVGGFITSNYCAPFAAVNITEYWDAKGVAGPADDVNGNPNLGVTNTAQYIGWWMNTNDDQAVGWDGCPYRVNGDPNFGSKSGTLLTDLATGLAQFVRWDANNTFGCGPALLGGKKGYSWTITANQNLNAGWNEIVAEIDGAPDLGQPPRPLIVVWNFWNPQNAFYNSDDGYTYYDWGPLIKQNPGVDPGEPTENWSVSEEIGHATTAVGYKQCKDPRTGVGPIINYVIVHDNWSITDCDVAVPFTHQLDGSRVWMANVKADPNLAPATPTLTVTVGAHNPGNHTVCPGASTVVYQINLAADNTDAIDINALTLVASGTGDDQNDITSIDLVNDAAPDNGVASKADGDSVLWTYNGGFPANNGTLTLKIPNTRVIVAQNGSINLLIVYHVAATAAANNTYALQLSAVYATGVTYYLPATVNLNNGQLMNSGTVSVLCLDHRDWNYPEYKIKDVYRLRDGTWLRMYSMLPAPRPAISAGGTTFGKKIYVNDPEIGGAGLRIDFTPNNPPTVQEASTLLQIEGRLTTVNGERVLMTPTIAITSPPGPPIPISPVAMANASAGGGDFLYDPIDGIGRRGMTGAVGLNTVGMLVRTTGSFAYVNPTTFTITDHSCGPVKCVVALGVSVNPSWGYLSVTGVCSCEKDPATDHVRQVILVRKQGDIVPMTPP